MLKYHAGAPMERVHLDFLGPLPRTARGNEFVLVMVDQFTKWVECNPLPSQTAEVTATSAVNASARGALPVRSQGSLAHSTLTSPPIRTCIAFAVVRTTAG